jgi:hypothetical protein
VRGAVTSSVRRSAARLRIRVGQAERVLGGRAASMAGPVLSSPTTGRCRVEVAKTAGALTGPTVAVPRANAVPM